MSIFIGLDLGCTGCKAIAVDDRGITRAAASKRYDGTLLYKGQGAYDQEALVLRESGLSCLKELISFINGKDVKAIGVTAQMHSLVALDSGKNVLRPMISCVDARNGKQISSIYQKTGGEEGFISFTNNRMVASCTGGKILWVKENEPELFKQISCVITPKDYFRMILTGNIGTDESDASGYGLYDVKARCWNRKLLELIGIPEHILPKVGRSNAFAGGILPEIAEYLGINDGVKVVMGGGDAIVQTAGAGAVDAGVYSVVLGSGGNISASTHEFYRNKEGLIQFYASPVPEMWTAYAGIMSIGNTTNWFRNVFAKGDKDPFETLEKEAAEVPAGSNGLLFYPSMLGQRNPVEDTNAKGIFIGLDIEHDRGHLFRAVLEGIAMGMKDVADTIIPACGKPQSLVLSGGGSQNDLWCQIFADIFQVTIKRAADAPYCGARGAALLAAGCGEGREALKERFRNAGTDKEWQPDPSKAGTYRQLFDIYKAIYPGNKKIFSKINSFREAEVY